MNTKFYYFCIREILNMKDIFIISDLSFLAFPLNAILCLLWAVAVYLLWKNARNSKLVKFLLSPTTVFISIALFASACLLIGFHSHSAFLPDRAGHGHSQGMEKR